MNSVNKLLIICVVSLMLNNIVLAGDKYYHQALGLTVEQQPSYQIERRFVGSVKSAQIAQIGFEGSGTVSEIFFDSGEHVAKGDLLAVQDMELLKIESQELAAQRAELKAKLNLVDANLKRVNSLKKKGYASDQKLDELQAERSVLLASLNRVRSAVNANRVKQKKARLLAPFDAIISQRQVDQGEVTAPGQSVFKLLQSGAAEISVGLPLRLINKISAEETFIVQVEGSSYPVNLLTIGSDVDPVTRTVEVRFQLPNEAKVFNGQLAYLLLTENYDKAGFWLPLTALTDGVRGLWNIYVMNTTEVQGVYQLAIRNITVLHATDEKAFVSGALKEGERVLATGLQRLVPGQRVRGDAEYDWVDQL